LLGKEKLVHNFAEFCQEILSRLRIIVSCRNRKHQSWTQLEVYECREKLFAGTSGLYLLPHDHVSQALQELHWLPIVKRIDYKLCLLFHKASIEQAPTYIADMLTPVSSVQSLSTQRSVTNGDYIVSVSNALSKHFYSVCLRLWNTC